jgi:uncharacterized protein YndB with AHSA1/START domain
VNETLNTEAGRTVLRMERRLAHPPEKVWRALTEPAHLSKWYPFDVVELEPWVGGKISVLGDITGEAVTVEGVVTEFDRPRVFAFSEDAGAVLDREGDNLLRFELRPDGDGCLLVFTHAFHDRPYAAANAAGWSACFDALEQVVAGRPVEMPDSYVTMHEAFVAAFGLDQGTVETTEDGWRVRFDRQLMQQPIDKVWATLATDAGTTEPGGPVPPAFTTDVVPAGTATAVAPPAVLEYDWLAGDRPAGRVRWELSSDPAGTRVTLTQTGPGELRELAATALTAWHAHLGRLAGRLPGAAR